MFLFAVLLASSISGEYFNTTLITDDHFLPQECHYDDYYKTETIYSNSTEPQTSTNLNITPDTKLTSTTALATISDEITTLTAAAKKNPPTLSATSKRENLFDEFIVKKSKWKSVKYNDKEDVKKSAVNMEDYRSKWAGANDYPNIKKVGEHESTENMLRERVKSLPPIKVHKPPATEQIDSLNATTLSIGDLFDVRVDYMIFTVITLVHVVLVKSLER